MSGRQEQGLPMICQQILQDGKSHVRRKRKCMRKRRVSTGATQTQVQMLAQGMKNFHSLHLYLHLRLPCTSSHVLHVNVACICVARVSQA